ncbi:MAG: hypothetical protein LBU87_05500 [Lactobacillales bacterium]|jgi:ribosomal protein S18 acetylase RimI-like enzyme|nr:hypothetical protein [Lactobacillales bacterium]
MSKKINRILSTAALAGAAILAGCDEKTTSEQRGMEVSLVNLKTGEEKKVDPSVVTQHNIVDGAAVFDHGDGTETTVKPNGLKIRGKATSIAVDPEFAERLKMMRGK